MKKLNFVKMRSIIRKDEIYYTFPQWEPKEVDGVVFLAVCMFEPTQDRTQQIHYIRKDSLERVK
jgi:hypothetical protein